MQKDDGQLSGITQSSDANRATVSQGLEGGPETTAAGTTYENDSRVDQGGVGGHIATVTQSGRLNQSDLDQTGSGNMALVRQNGTTGSSTVTQSGDGAMVDIDQARGMRNDATVRQAANGTATVDHAGDRTCGRPHRSDGEHQRLDDQADGNRGQFRRVRDQQPDRQRQHVHHYANRGWSGARQPGRHVLRHDRVRA